MKALQGRTNRATYWACIALMVVLITAIGFLARKPSHISEGVLIFICVPRLHDIGKSGWLVLWPIGFEILGTVALISFPQTFFLPVFGVINLIFCGLLIWLGCIPGQNTPNRFGDPPSPGIQWRKSRNA